MKVCIVSVLKDGTGYSHAAINTALSLNSVGVDVVCRNISLINKRSQPFHGQDIIESFLNKDTNNIDAVIQICLPSTFQKINDVKSIGYFAWETTDFKKSNWVNPLSQMDQIWSMCLQQKLACQNSGIAKESKIIPIGCNPNRFDNVTEKTLKNSEILKSQFGTSCVFYCIAENNRRKNFPSLLRAYYMTFDKSDDVKLVIKSSPGSAGDFARAINEIKQSIHIHDKPEDYPTVMVIDQYLDQNDLDSIHIASNYFITCSKGESWCLPAHDAMAFGNKVIVPNWGSFPDLLHGQTDYFDKDKQIWRNPGKIKEGWLFNGCLSPCFGMTEIPHLYSGRELWFEPDIVDIGRCMREAYNEFKSSEPKDRESPKNRAREFTFEKVGAIIQKEINS